MSGSTEIFTILARETVREHGLKRGLHHVAMALGTRSRRVRSAVYGEPVRVSDVERRRAADAYRALLAERIARAKADADRWGLRLDEHAIHDPRQLRLAMEDAA